MHEFSIGERIVEAVRTEVGRLNPPPVRVTRVRLTVGKLHQIIPDYLTFAFQTLTKETLAEGSELIVAESPVRGRCRACGWEGEIEVPFFSCGACKTTQIETTQGMELRLDGLEVELDE